MLNGLSFSSYLSLYIIGRGGGGANSSWHKAGSGSNKLNSVNDFVACGEYLVNEGYVHKDRLGAIGFSAGGLLVGAAINIYPDLFRAAILKVSSNYTSTRYFFFLYTVINQRYIFM